MTIYVEVYKPADKDTLLDNIMTIIKKYLISTDDSTSSITLTSDIGFGPMQVYDFDCKGYVAKSNNYHMLMFRDIVGLSSFHVAKVQVSENGYISNAEVSIIHNATDSYYVEVNHTTERASSSNLNSVIEKLASKYSSNDDIISGDDTEYESVIRKINELSKSIDSIEDKIKDNYLETILIRSIRNHINDMRDIIKYCKKG